MVWLFLIIGLIVIVLISNGNTKSIKAKEPTRKQIEVNLKDYQEQYTFDVKGVHLQDYMYPVLNYCKELDLISLIAEPENKYDSHAIKVINSGWHIGYVPADEVLEIHEILKKEYIAYIENIEKLGYISVSIKIRYKV